MPLLYLTGGKGGGDDGGRGGQRCVVVVVCGVVSGEVGVGVCGVDSPLISTLYHTWLYTIFFPNKGDDGGTRNGQSCIVGGSVPVGTVVVVEVVVVFVVQIPL